MEIEKPLTILKMLTEDRPDRKCSTCPATIPGSDPEWFSQCPDCFQDERTKRNCTVCNKPKISCTAEAWKTVCATCYNESPLRQCNGCKVYNIKAVEPSWRNYCQECYKNKQFERVCEECKVRPIKSSLPKYVKNCTKCYIDKKSLTHEPCPSCPPEMQKLLRKRKSAPSCRECMIGQGLIKTMAQPIVM